MTQGLSPKLIAAALTTLVVALLNRFVLEVDRELEVALNVILTTAATYLAPPGEVIIDEGPANDDLLDLPPDTDGREDPPPA